MAGNPKRKWMGFVIVHLVVVAGAVVIAGSNIEAGNPAGFGLPLTLAGLAGGALMAVGMYVQRDQLVYGSWIVLVGLIPTLFSPTGMLVLISGFWTGNLVLGKKAAAIGSETSAGRRVDALGQRWWAWFVAAGALLAVGYVALSRANVLLWGLAFPAGALSALIGIGAVSRAPGRQRTDSSSELRVATTVGSLKNGWWLLGSGLIAVVFAILSVGDFLNTDGAAVYERIVEAAFATVAATVIFVGLVARIRGRRFGSALIAIGVLPGAAAVLLFWHPGFVLFGLLSMAVIATAFTDARAGKDPVAVRI